MSHILVVDDDIDLRECLAEVLKHQGYSVSAVDSVTAAMNFLESGHPVELILSDYLMQGGSGMDLLEYVRKTRGLKPHFILLTGQSEVVREVAMDCGAQEFVLKPFDIPELLGTIEKYMN